MIGGLTTIVMPSLDSTSEENTLNMSSGDFVPCISGRASKQVVTSGASSIDNGDRSLDS